MAAAAATLFAPIGSFFGVSGAGAATAGLGITSSLIGGVAQFAALSSQSAALEEAARVEEANAKLAIQRGQIDAQDADFELAAILAENEAQQASSGILTGSGSFRRVRTRVNTIGRANRQRIIQDSSIQANNAQARANSRRSQSRSSRLESAFSLVSTGINIGSGLIDGANLSAREQISSTNRRRVAI